MIHSRNLYSPEAAAPAHDGEWQCARRIANLCSPSLLCAGSTVRAADDDGLAAVAVGVLREQLGSIQTLEFKFEQSVPSEADKPVQGNQPQVASIANEVHLDGRRARLKLTWFDKAGAYLGGSVNAYDGKHTYHVDYDKRDPAKMITVTRQPSKEIMGILTPASFLGVRLFTLDSDRTLASIIVGMAPESLHVERGKGRTLVSGSVADVELYPGKKYSVDFVLDSSIGWLPRFLSARPRVSPAPQFGDEAFYTQRLECLEFGQFDDGLTGSRRWFPTRCRRSIAGTITDYTVTHVAINRPMPDELFTIKAVAGARVVDLDVPVGQPPCQYYEGGITTQESSVKESVDALMGPDHAALVAIDAGSPAAGWPWARAVRWGSFTIIVLVAVRWLVRR